MQKFFSENVCLRTKFDLQLKKKLLVISLKKTVHLQDKNYDCHDRKSSQFHDLMKSF